MIEKIKTGSNNAGESGSDSDSSSTDSDTQTITPQSAATSPPEIAEQQHKTRDTVTASDDDDTSSSDSSTEDEDVTSHRPNADSNTKNTPSDRSAIETSHQTATEAVALRQNPTAANDRSVVAKKEAARLSARLGHMAIVDSVVVRKKFRDRLSQNQLYTEISNLVTDNTDQVGTEKEDPPHLTNNDDTKPTPSQSPHGDSESSKPNDVEENSSKSVSDDESDLEGGPESGKQAKVEDSREDSREVSREVSNKESSDLDEVELDNMAESRDDTASVDSERCLLSSCCCFRKTRTS
ncbi:hypothetical protein BsWGS_24515 [Bradybaena similaris]